MTEEINFLKEDVVKPLEIETVVEKLATTDIVILDPDELVKNHEAMVADGIPEKLILIGDDGTEIPYKRLPDPRCSVCKSMLCQEAERTYVNSGFDLKSVVDFFKEAGFKMSPNTVRKHFEQHCDFGHLKESWLVKAQLRKDEIIQHNNELTEILMGDVMDTIIDIKGRLPGVTDIKDLSQLLSSLAKFHQIIQQYERLRTEKKEFEDQIASVLMEKQQENIKELLGALLTNAETEAEKSRVATIINNFLNRRN